MKRTLLTVSLAFVIGTAAYQYFWGQYTYLITAYCNCPICINVEVYQDSRFASGRKVFWGGIAADPSVPFGSEVELVPVWPAHWWSIYRILENRKDFRVEDRGGKIKGRHLDIFIPHSMGGHENALEWGVRRMRIRLNGELAR